MIPIELDINKIDQISKTKESENLRFRSFLKGKDDDELDIIVHGLYDEIINQIDCTKCGNCCMTFGTSLTDKEIDTLSKIDNVSRDVFIEKYTEEDDFEKEKYLKDIPCRYLSDKKCSIYINRPEECRSFPHVHKQDFNSRTLGMISYYEICPIVFNLIERLKIVYRFS